MNNLPPELPIFVVEGHDVYVYESLARAEGDLEPQDVTAGVYTAYDALGRYMKIETDGKSTTLSLAEAEETGARDLEEPLRGYLKAMGEPRARDTQCDLPCLVEAAREHATEHLRGVLRFLTRLRRRKP